MPSSQPATNPESQPEASVYPTDERNKVRRRPDRGAYDHETVHALLDAGMMCHIAYVVDGLPYCTPTLYWREGNRLYWHGSSASRMLQTQSSGLDVCLTVTHLDAVVLARCGFNHSVDYRAVMAFGTAHVVDDPQFKEAALVAMVDRLFPNRTASLRESTRQEIRSSTVIGMDIDQASAKVRQIGVADNDDDRELPIYAEVIPVHTVLGEPEANPGTNGTVERPASLAGWHAGRKLEDALVEAYRETFGT